MLNITEPETKMIACPDQNTLAEYLGGWVDERESAAIERHLEACSACQATISSVETEPDSMLGNGAATADKPVHGDAVVDYAISVSKRIPAADKVLEDEEDSEEWAARFAARSIGPYQLIRPLGHGGMGSVYLARHCKLEKLVAIKILPSRWLGSDVHLNRFQREIRAAGGLNHPVIVTATDAGEEDGVYYLVMEYIEGYDLSRATRLCGRFRVADACEVIRLVALGLSHAHSLGIVHRDIKPSNLMLSQTGDVKILDFGLARHSLWDEASAELTTVGQLMGTLNYMAPEQAECASGVDYRADLYSLGATLFRLLVGRPPLAAAPDLSPLAKLKLLASHDSPRADTLRPDLPKELTDIIASMLHRDPDGRPASAAHVAEKLEKFAVDSDLQALAETAKRNDEAGPSGASTSELQNPAKTIRPVASGGGKKGQRWAMALAGFSGLVLAGILLVIETQKGQLVIESEAENVSVKLLADGKQYDVIEVQPGATATKLFAGKYELEIEGGSDGFLIDNESVVIRKGETIIAKVRRTGLQEPLISLPAQLLPAQLTEEPVYEGQPLSIWLNRVATERSPEQLYMALEAVRSLVGPSNAERVRSSLLSTMSTVQNLSVFSERKNSLLDIEIVSIISDSFDDQALFFEYIVQRLKESDPALQKRIYPMLSRFDDTKASPLVRYLSETVLREGADDDILILAANYARNYLLLSRTTETELDWQLAKQLYQNKKLGLDFWLEYLPTNNFFGYAEVVQLKAIEAFNEERISDKLLTQAAIILREFQIGDDTVQVSLSDGRRQQLAELVVKQLEQIAKQPDRFTGRVEVENSLSKYAVPAKLSLPFFPSGIRQISVSDSRPKNALLTLELFKLTETLGELGSTDQVVLQLISRLLEPALEAAIKLNPNGPGAAELSHELRWPDLQLSSRFTRPGNRANVETIQDESLIAYLTYSAGFHALSEEAKQIAKDAFISRFVAKMTGAFITKYDNDGDGALSSDEFPQSESQFQRFDQNVDGLLSRDEVGLAFVGLFETEVGMLDFLNAMALKIDPSQPVDPRFLEYAKKIIARSDRDGDGALSISEQSGTILDLTVADLNKDGKITVLEYAAYLQHRSRVQTAE